MIKQVSVKSVLDALVNVSVCAASIVMMWYMITTHDRSSNPSTAMNAASVVENLDAKGMSIAIKADDRLKRPTARVALVEFSDFECPYCGRYARETFPTLKREFIESGKVTYVFRNFPLEGLHPHALGAAKAAECARHQDRFWDMHDWIFMNQRQLGPTELRAHARELRIDEHKFAECLDGGSMEVTNDAELGRRLGVNSTPTFFLGEIGADGNISVRRRIMGAVPADVFRTALAELLKSAPKA